MSENDIQNGHVISRSDLNKRDLEWLKGNRIKSHLVTIT